MTDSMNFLSSTGQEMLLQQSESMNFSDFERLAPLPLSEAHAILDRVKDGIATPTHLIDQALRTTGDLT